MRRTRAVLPFLVAAALAPQSAAAAPTTVEFGTPGSHDWVVPPDVRLARFELFGGEGGAGYTGGGSVPGGKGARVVGNLAVTPGETLSIVVAGAGAANGVAGHGGGGAGGSSPREDGQSGGGGGASSVGRGVTALIVAGGGGGGGSWGGVGGAAGADGGTDGTWDGAGGRAGTASAGGAPGAGGAFPSWHCSNRVDGLAGRRGTAGAGGAGGDAAHEFAPSGGGGGGGWFGGGGGGSGAQCLSLGAFNGGGGGGGGSSHLDAAVAHGTIAAGDRAGNGIVTIMYGDTWSPAARPQVEPAPGPSGWSAEDVTVTWNWSDVGDAGVDAGNCQAATTSAGDGDQRLTGTCADTFGNVGEAGVRVRVDTTPPEIDVEAPIAGEYELGDAVAAAFTCTDATAGVESCVGSTADGAPLDTAAPGQHRLTVTATDLAGNETTVDVDYTVVARPPAEPQPIATAPVDTSSVPPRVTAPRLLVFRPAAAVECPAADACSVVARRGGRVVARGSGELRVRMRLTAHGRRMLARRLGGAGVRLHAVATSAGERRSFTLRRRAVLGVERAVTPPGSFAANSARLTAIGRRFAMRLRAAAGTVERARCDGYAAGETLSRTNAYEISLERARRLCAVLGGVPTRVVGHGTLDPRVNDRTESGRAVNRRVAITLHH